MTPMKRDPLALEGREHDLLVIGGGIAGAWTVYEAASRGLKAALIESEDFGQATSWSSLKTAHGGLRHLQRLDVAGFRESVLERRALLRVAPEVVKPLGFAVTASSVFDQVKFFLGGMANDLLSFDRNEGVSDDREIGPSRLVDRTEGEALGAAPLAADRVFIWQDAQITHTERLLMSLLHAATDASAIVANHCRIVSAASTTTGFEIRALDAIGGQTLTLQTRAVVNAAGASLEDVARLFDETCDSPPLIRGANIVLAGPSTSKLALGARDHGRFLFLVPWQGCSILGTMYDRGARSVERLVQELLAAGKRAFPWAQIEESRIRVVHSGYVPGGPDGEPIYRSRVIAHRNPRVVSILTAKYTTARRTAEKAVDHLGPTLGVSLALSVSATRPLDFAKPLSGPIDDQLRFAEEGEMATSRAEAMRGRLIEGAGGDEGRS